MVCTTCNVHKFEILFHIFCHPLQETVEFLANIFLERGSLPAPHFLDLSVRISCKLERIGATALKGMCVDLINWYPSRDGVLEDRCGQFDPFADVFPAYKRFLNGPYVCVGVQPPMLVLAPGT